MVDDISRLDMLKQVLAENPNDGFARYGLALEYVNHGDPENGLAELRKVIELHPDYVPAYQMAAQTLLRAGRAEEARPLLEAGVQRARHAGNSKAVSEMQGMLDEIS